MMLHLQTQWHMSQKHSEKLNENIQAILRNLIPSSPRAMTRNTTGSAGVLQVSDMHA